MSEPKPLSWQFDDAAQLYDEVRPRYPEEIVERIIAFAALPTHAHIFEVGCGTGQMTLPFARRGHTMVALDQGERLGDRADGWGSDPGLCNPGASGEEGITGAGEHEAV